MKHDLHDQLHEKTNAEFIDYLKHQSSNQQRIGWCWMGQAFWIKQVVVQTEE